MVVVAIVLGVLILGVLALAGVLLQVMRHHGSLLFRIDELETRVRALHELAGAGSPSNGAGPHALPPGSVVSRFRLPDFTGRLVGLEELPGRRLVVHWNPQCGFCEQIAGDLAKQDAGLRRQGVQLVLVTWGNVEENREFAEAHGLRCPILLLDGSEPLEAFGGLGTPVAYLLDADGRTERAAAIGADQILDLVGELTSGRKTVPNGQPVSASRIERQGLPAGTRAPSFVLPGLDGDEVSLDDFRGREVLLVFSDPHCGPCNDLAPELVRAHAEARDEFALLMVSRGSTEENREKAADHGVTFPVVIQPGWRISKQYGIFETPVAFRIDARGVIAADVARGRDAILALAATMARREEVAMVEA